MERKVGFQSGVNVAEDVGPALARAAVLILLAIFPAAATLDRRIAAFFRQISSSESPSRSLQSWMACYARPRCFREPERSHRVPRSVLLEPAEQLVLARLRQMRPALLRAVVEPRIARDTLLSHLLGRLRCRVQGRLQEL